WCLYGQETQVLLETKSEKATEKGVANENAYDNNGSEWVSVRPTIKIPELPQLYTVIVERKAKFVRGNLQPVFAPELNVQTFDKAGMPQYHGFDSQQILNSILVPKELASFYLFDGEYLKQTQKVDTEINSGFSKLFRINTFKQVAMALGEIYTEYSNDAAKSRSLNTALQAKYTKLSFINQELTEKKGDAERISKELTGLYNDRKKTMDEAQASISLIKIKEQYQNIKSERDVKRKDLEAAKNELSMNILQSMHLLNSEDIRNDVLKKIENIKEIKENKLPPEVREPFLKGILKKGTCICGRELKKGSKEVEKIQTLINEFSETNEKEFLVDLRYNIESTRSEVSKVRESINSIENKIKKLNGDIDKLNDDIDKIVAENKDVDREIAENPIEKVKYLDEQILAKESEKKDAEQKRDELSRDLESLKEEIEKMENKAGTGKDLINRINIVATLNSIIETFSKKAVENFSKLLEEEINKLLKANEKLNVFKVERKISESGEVEFVFKEEGSQSTYFSGGQQQLKGIIQIAAFTRVIDKVFKDKLAIPFVVMDHPISDVDKERIKKIAGEIGGLFRNSQVILFVANDKFDVFNTISKESISNKLLVKKDSETKESSIEELR
ncbi:MAG: hypothetical protein QXL94_06500, partial [Candidatus Parvarchaeum sp.]